MKKKYLKYFGFALAIILFFILIKLSNVIEFAKNTKVETQEDKIILIVGVIIIMHFVLLIHELGHVIMGLLQGFRFELLVVGLLGIKREEEKIKIYLNKNFGYYGGLGLTVPKDDSSDNLRKFANVILAGPIASIVFAVICFFVVNYLANPYGVIVFAAGLASFGIFLATTIPSRSGMFYTDRKRYQRLIKAGKDQQVELAMLTILGSYVKNQSYKDIKKEVFDVLITDNDSFVKHYGLFNLICWQIEHEGAIDDKVKEEYNEISKKLNKNMVKSYNDEIQKYSDKIQKLPD
ncbi:MAG: M50 family metallopeptidase [Flavobacterium macrobrachii]